MKADRRVTPERVHLQVNRQCPWRDGTPWSAGDGSVTTAVPRNKLGEQVKPWSVDRVCSQTLSYVYISSTSTREHLLGS